MQNDTEQLVPPTGSRAVHHEPIEPLEWPLSNLAYDARLDFGHDMRHTIGGFVNVRDGQLSESTEVTLLRCSEGWKNPQDAVLNDSALKRVLKEKRSKAFELYCINRFICRPQRPQPNDARRLRISPTAFKALTSRHNIPAAFLAAISREYQTCGTGFRRQTIDHVEGISITTRAWEHWCMLPVRVAVPCGNTDDQHARSTAGSNQMDPFNYVHLSDSHVDVRGSHVGLFLRHDPATPRVTVVCVSFLDGRWPELVDEPLDRMREIILQRGQAASEKDIVPGQALQIEPSFVHQVFLSSTLRWWNHVLLAINSQLIAHEKVLQTAMDSADPTPSSLNTTMNKSLHIIAAHLYRYRSELNRLSEVMDELATHYDPSSMSDEVNMLYDNTQQAFGQMQSQLKAVCGFHAELERKIQNILALLFNNIQVTNDRTMQAILREAQNDTRLSQNLATQSYNLSQQMRQDSIAMKTIAILTMVFLPGTSYAALLSMPFFQSSAYLSDPQKVWIWVLVTVPSTAVAFAIYRRVTNKSKVVDFA